MSDREYLPSGDELRAGRIAAGLSQRAVAERIGTTQRQISTIETGAESVSDDVRRRYAEFLEEVGTDE
jgi:transcriptional regulator with XRE-family HTH domain